MTLTKLMQLGLARAGLSTSNTIFLDRARDYFNEGTKDLAQRHDWRWLIKSSTITTADGTKTYSLAADVLKPLMFVHTTDDVTMAMVDIQEMIQAAPDNDEEGASRFVVVNGINSSTGYWEVDLHPIPDANSETITYHYFAFVPDKTSLNDNTDLASTMPEWAQWAMVHFIAARYKGEKGDEQGETNDFNSYLFAVESNIKTDEAQDGNEHYRFPRRGSTYPMINFVVQTGTLG